MDISLSNKRNGTQIKPTSIHGILWLQTHFESEHWESISNGQVIVPRQDAEMLGGDAQNAGLCLLYTSPSPRDVEESRMPSSA